MIYLNVYNHSAWMQIWNGKGCARPFHDYRVTLTWLDMTGIDLNTCVPWLYDNFKQLNLFVTFSIFKKYNHVLFWILKKLVIEIMFWFYFQFCFNSYCFVCKLLFLKISWVCFCGLKYHDTILKIKWCALVPCVFLDECFTI